MARRLAVVSLLFFACDRREASRLIELHQSSSPTSAQGMELARVGSRVLTAHELRSRIEAGGPELRARYRDATELRAYLDNQIRFEILAEEALRQGLDRDPEVQETARKTMVQKLLRGEIDQKLKPGDFSPEEVARFYQDNLGDYHQAERVRVAWLEVASRGQAEEAISTWKRRSKEAAVFAELASRFALPGDGDAAPSAFDEGKDARFHSRDELAARLPSEVVDAAFAIREIGEFAPILGSPRGFFVVRLTGRRQGVDRPLDQVDGQIRQRLYRERRTEHFEALVKKLKDAARVTVDEAALARLADELGAPASQPVAP